MTNQSPFFKTYKNASAITAGTTTTQIISDADKERFGPFQYIAGKNKSTETLRLIFDGVPDDEKSIEVLAGESFEFIGILIFENVALKNEDGSAQMEINETEIYVGNLLPQEQVQLGKVRRLKSGEIVV